MCEAPLNDLANGGSVSVPRFLLMSFFTYGEYGFIFKGSWSHSR